MILSVKVVENANKFVCLFSAAIAIIICILLNKSGKNHLQQNEHNCSIEKHYRVKQYDCFAPHSSSAKIERRDKGKSIGFRNHPTQVKAEFQKLSGANSTVVLATEYQNLSVLGFFVNFSVNDPAEMSWIFRLFLNEIFNNWMFGRFTWFNFKFVFK